MRKFVAPIIIAAGSIVSPEALASNNNSGLKDSVKTEQQLKQDNLVELANLFNELNSRGLLDYANKLDYKDQLRIFGFELGIEEQAQKKYVVIGRYTFQVDDLNINQGIDSLDCFEITFEEDNIKTHILVYNYKVYGWCSSQESHEGFMAMDDKELAANKNPFKYPFLIGISGVVKYWKFLNPDEIKDILNNINKELKLKD